MGERVDFPAGGYLATGEGAGLGVIVIPERAAVALAPVEPVCDRLAAEGFTAFAPDSPAGAPALSSAVDFLVDHPAVRGHGVGVIGFGTGGGLALALAGARPDQVRAVVPFYATFPSPGPEPDWDRLEAPVEGHYGGADDPATLQLAHHLEDELVSRGREVRLFFYPGAGHGFFDGGEDAARQAWVRTLEFLRAKLG